MRYEIVFSTDPPLTKAEREIWPTYLRDLADAIARGDDVNLPVPEYLVFTGHRGVVARSVSR